MLELRQAEGEIVRLLAPDEPEALERALRRLRRDRPEPLAVLAPAGEGGPDRLAHLGGLDAEAPGEVLGDLVGRLRGEREPAQPGEDQLLERARVRGRRTVPVHGDSLTPVVDVCSPVSGASGRGRAAGSSVARAGARARTTRASARPPGRASAPGRGSSAASSWRVGLSTSVVPPTDWISPASSCLRRAHSGSRSLIQSSSGAATKIEE